MLTSPGFFLTCFCQWLCVDFTLVHVYISNDIASYKCLITACKVRNLSILWLANCWTWQWRDLLEHAYVSQVKIELFIYLLKISFYLDTILHFNCHSYWDLFTFFSKWFKERPKEHWVLCHVYLKIINDWFYLIIKQLVIKI